MTSRSWIGSAALIAALATVAASLGTWKLRETEAAVAASLNQPDPVESVTAAVARHRDFQDTTSIIGTVVALRSITLRNELPGTVQEVRLEPGAIVEAGTVLVALDVAVEEAELRAQEAQARLTETILNRTRRLLERNAVSEEDLERAQADRDIAVAQVARTRAVIERKTIRAPFRARVGIADVHPGQYLNEGTQITTLQGVADAAYIDFSVEQEVAAWLKPGAVVEVSDGSGNATAIPAEILAVDARVNSVTRNATIRVRIDRVTAAAIPGASMRVRVPVGPERGAVAVPASALRKGPMGDHVFVLSVDPDGDTRARFRQVTVGAQLGDAVMIDTGLAAGERVAAAGSFKLRDETLVAVASEQGLSAL